MALIYFLSTECITSLYVLGFTAMNWVLTNAYFDAWLQWDRTLFHHQFDTVFLKAVKLNSMIFDLLLIVII